MTAGIQKMDLNSLFARAAMMFEKSLTDVKVVFAQPVPLGKVRNGVVY